MVREDWHSGSRRGNLVSGQATIREADGWAQDTTETGLKLDRSPQPGTSEEMAELGLHSDSPPARGHSPRDE